MKSRRDRAARAVGAVFMLLGAAGAALAQTPTAQTPQAPMAMANMDHRGGIRGTVLGANNAPVADTAVTAVDAANGARFEATTDARGAYAFAALPVGRYTITVVSAGLTAFRRQGVDVAADQNAELNIALDAASAARPRTRSGRNCFSSWRTSSSASPIWRRTPSCRSRKHACAASRSSSTRTATSTTRKYQASRRVRG